MKTTTFFLKKYGRAMLLGLILPFISCLSIAQNSSNCYPGNTNAPGTCPSAKIDAAIMIDQSFVDQFGGNIATARSHAEEVFNTMATNLSSKLSQLGYTVNFKIVHFPTIIVANSWNTGSTHDWVKHIRDTWNVPARNCIVKDGIILLTGQSVGLDGVQDGTFFCDEGINANSQVTIVQNQPSSIPATAKVLAHEMMHNFGLSHLDSSIELPGGNIVPATTCYMQCGSSQPPLMCTYGGGYYFSTCDEPCLKRFFDETKCQCLNVESPFRASDFVCPTIVNIAFSFFNDNPNPIRNCHQGRDEMTISVTLNNNDQVTSRNIRLRLNDTYKNYLEIIPLGTSDCTDAITGEILCFNTTVDLPGVGKEFRILKPDGNEQFFNVEAGEQKTVKIKVRYIRSDTPSSPNDYMFSMGAYSGTLGSPGTTYLDIKPFVEINATSPQKLSDLIPNGQWPVTLPLFIKGKIIIDPFNVPTQNTYDFSSNKNVLFAPGASMEIANTKTTMMQVDVGGCDQMWKGITVRSGSEFLANKITISDAQYGIFFRRGSKGTITGSTFNRNNFGIYTEPINSTNGTGSINLLVNGNVYKCSETPLKASYTGQSPLPSEKGYVGLFLNDISGVVIQKDANGCFNLFDNLATGAIGINSTFSIQDALFSNITEPSTSSTENYPTGLNGTAVYAEKSMVHITGMGFNAEAPYNFNNCDYGIDVLNSTLTASDNHMHDMRTGMRARATINQSINISQNRIDATLRGIDLFYTAFLAQSHGISNNIITMAGSESGIGIQIIGPQSHQSKFANVNENIVNMDNGYAGIRISGGTKSLLFRNSVFLNSASNNRLGFTFEGTSVLHAGCNNVNGSSSSNETGFKVYATYHSTLGCNNVSGSSSGVNFSGDCSLSTVRGNTMQSASIGMLYGLSNGISSVLVGTQTDQGNIWENTTLTVGAQYNGNINNIDQNKYTVDETQDARFLPSSIVSLLLWFSSHTSSSSYHCYATTADCPDNAFGSPAVNDKDRIAGGNVYASDFESTLRGQAQKHLYCDLAETGLPSGSSTTIQNFYNASGSPTYKTFGDLDVAIRTAYRISGQNDGALSGYENALLQSLDHLEAVDRQLSAPNLSASDSARLQSNRDSILLAVQSIQNNWLTLLSSVDQSRASSLTGLSSQNTTLSDAALWNTNEKTVNSIFLNTLGAGVYNLNETQTGQLKSVAGQCPLEGGEAVYWARTMLEGMTGKRPIYNDETLCQPIQNRQLYESTANQMVRIYPNPNTGSFDVFYKINTAEGTSVTFLLYNMYGQEVHRETLPDTTGSLHLNLGWLPPGTYFFVIPSGTGSISGKMSVFKG